MKKSLAIGDPVLLQESYTGLMYNLGELPFDSVFPYMLSGNDGSQ